MADIKSRRATPEGRRRLERVAACQQTYVEEPLSIDLTGADLREVDVSGANLSSANLCEADLCPATLIVIRRGSPRRSAR